MTADHAGQTGGEREGDQEISLGSLIERWSALDAAPWVVRVKRGVRNYEGRVAGAARTLDGVGELRIAIPVGEDILTMPLSTPVTILTPSRPVPVPGQPLGAALGEVTVGQAAREAAVEVALLADSPLWNGVVFGVDPSKRAEFWQRVAQVAVAALSAAPGQEQSSVRQAADVLSDRELGDALDLWWAQREQAETGQEQGR